MPASDGAMRAAKRIRDFDKGILPTEEYVAQIIDEETGSGWIKCSERMPTKDDADRWGNVLWCSIDYHSVALPWAFPNRYTDYTHWQTLLPDEKT